jgi:CheY-like chemotaxis protein
MRSDAEWHWERLDTLPSPSTATNWLNSEMDGFHLVVALQEHPEWRHIPVVVITALDLSAEDRARLNSASSLSC